MDKDLSQKIKMGIWSLTIFFVIMSAFFIVQILNGEGGKNYDTITVDADAEVFASPDIAEISFTIRKEDPELSVAQEEVDEIVNSALELVYEIGIDEKDVKTAYYNANPRYDYNRAICNEFGCGDEERVLTGYEVSQSINIKVRDLDNVGKILASLGDAKVTDIYGPNFRIEDEDELKTQVRDEAIQKAKDKAKDLAKSLGVRIVGIENFSENGYGGIYYAKTMAFDSAVAEGYNEETSFEPNLPQGENKIQSNVTITYRVK